MSQNDSNPTSDSNPVDRAVRIGHLIDLYGPLLTARQLEFTKLHYSDDLSFGEIAEDFGVSRQAVHDAVKHAERSLEEYDAKLGLTPGQVARPAESAQKDTASSSLAPATPRAVDGLGPCVRAIEEIHERIQRSGGVIYNADGLARDLGQVLDRLRQLDSGN